MESDERDRQIEVSINRWATSKIPRNAKRGAWKTFHDNWKRESMGARDLAVEVYKGYSFAPCFNGRKIKADFDCAWHLALDFDCADERASFEHLLQDDLIEWFSSFLYYTPTSDPPAYKSRVVFIFDEPVLTVEAYEDIQAAFAWRFPDSDQSTTDAARFFYGSKKGDLHPQWSILPLESAKEIVRQHKAAIPKKAITAKNYQPITPDDEKVQQALKHIPVKQSYVEWLRVCMAVHSAYPNQKGISLLESWSPGYDGEIADKFNSFDRTKTDGVTIRTLYKIAIDHGWKPLRNGGYKAKTDRTKMRDDLMKMEIGRGRIRLD
jgi:hypothetical protein